MKETWRVTKTLTESNPNIPPLTINGKTTTTTQEKLKCFANTLEHVFTINPDFDHSFTVNTEQEVNDFLKLTLADRVRATNLSEIAWIFRHLKPLKAAGPN
jgi:hypothetical protein